MFAQACSKRLTSPRKRRKWHTQNFLSEKSVPNPPLLYSLSHTISPRQTQSQALRFCSSFALNCSQKGEFRQGNRQCCKFVTLLLLPHQQGKLCGQDRCVHQANYSEVREAYLKLTGNKYIYKHYKETINTYLPQNHSSITERKPKCA